MRDPGFKGRTNSPQPPRGAAWPLDRRFAALRLGVTNVGLDHFNSQMLSTSPSNDAAISATDRNSVSGSSFDGVKPYRRQNAPAFSFTAFTTTVRPPIRLAAVTRRRGEIVQPRS